MGVIRIAQAQINSVVGDFEGNSLKIKDMIDQARSLGADLVTFPELALCGYPPEDLLLKRGFLEDNNFFLQALKPACENITAIIGFADSDGGEVFNAAALISDSKLVAVYHKIELPNYGVFDEKRYFNSDCECVLFEIDGIRISLTICEDIWIKGSLTRTCAVENGAQVVVNISASPFHAGKMAVRKDIIADFASTTKSIMFFNNLVGGQDELVFDGGSLAMDPSGSVLSAAKRFEEDLLLTELELPEGRSTAAWNTEGPIPKLRKNPHKPHAPFLNRIEPELTRIQEIHDALVLGTRDYVTKNGFRKVVIGLSGGIDSALTAALAVEALGADHVIGVTMPSQYTSSETLSDAELVAANLGIRLITVHLGEIFAAYLNSLKDAFGEGKLGVEAENLQARIRGNILMALSNRCGWLVLTTGNKSETAVGYCTLYGDMAGGFAVIKDVPKTVVYQLSEYVNTKAGQAVIPETTIQRAPSADLRPDQKDEDSLPPYSVLDPLIEAYVEEDQSPDMITGADPKIIWDVVKMVDVNEYKRRQAPPGVKITPKAFGRDRRLPITNRYLNSRKRSSS
jgi:NAD+ synthase (glutamine-hydrolysing)